MSAEALSYRRVAIAGVGGAAIRIYRRNATLEISNAVSRGLNAVDARSTR